MTKGFVDEKSLVGEKSLGSGDSTAAGAPALRHTRHQTIVSPGFSGLPPHARGQRIGLFGGSFNPPHAGHRAASLLALRRLGLDKIWWLVSPGNPLKDNGALPPAADRLEAARNIAAHPKIMITRFEEALGSPFTCDTVAYLESRCPGVHFVWLMGADSLAGFHLWKNWRRIANTFPMAIVDRPGSTLRAVQTRAAAALRAYRIGESAGRTLPDAAPPAFIFLHGKRSPLSSTELRKTRLTEADGQDWIVPPKPCKTGATCSTEGGASK